MAPLDDWSEDADFDFDDVPLQAHNPVAGSLAPLQHLLKSPRPAADAFDELDELDGFAEDVQPVPRAGVIAFKDTPKDSAISLETARNRQRLQAEPSGHIPAGSGQVLGPKPPNTTSPSPRSFAAADAGDWGEGDDDAERELTLKARGDTLRSLMAPLKQDDGTIRPSRGSTSGHSRYSEDNEETGWQEDSFNLPSDMAKLKLAPPKPRADSPLRTHAPRTSINSAGTPPPAINTDWDSPGSLVPSGSRPSARRSFATSPSTSTTSVTSFSLTGADNSDDQAIKIADQDEDMEDGLQLPNPTFFSSGRIAELNSLLDRKRNPQPFPSNHPPVSMGNTRSTSGTSRSSSTDLTRPTIASAARSRTQERRDESFEDGLILEDAAAELNARRLLRLRRNRPAAGPQSGRLLLRANAAPMRRSNAGGPAPSRSGFIGLADLAHSTEGAAAVPPAAPNAPAATRSVTDPSNQARMPPSSASRAYTPSRLRSQKSFSRLQQPPPSPSIHRKQSLQSLLEGPPAVPPPRPRFGSDRAAQGPYHSYEAQTAASIGRTQRDRATEITPPSSSNGSGPRIHASSEQAVIDRLTMPTSSSRAKARPAIASVFARTSPPHPPLPTAPRAQILAQPRRGRSYGDGTELDAFDDLEVDRHKEVSRKVPVPATSPPSRSAAKHLETAPATPLPSSVAHRAVLAVDKKRKLPTSTRKPARKPALIRKMGGDGDKEKTVGEMTWNPRSLRWEGNYSALRDFEQQPVPSSRPALISHYTAGSTQAVSSPGGVTQSASAVKIVGDMRFDPDKMCWVSILAPEDEEPDPFADMADDDDSFDRGATITRHTSKAIGTLLHGLDRRVASESAESSTTSLDGGFSGHRNFSQAPAALAQQTRAAEARHKQDMRGWAQKAEVDSADFAERLRRDEKRLWEIRNLALRSG